MGPSARPHLHLLAIATAALLVLLAVLATLQYRWIGEVSEADRERMGRAAREAAAGVSFDFDSEVARLLHNFLFTSHTSDEPDPGRRLAQSARAWASTARFPEMLSGVLLARPGSTGELELARVDPVSGTLDPATWPPPLDALRREIENAPAIPFRPLAGPMPGMIEARRERGPQWWPGIRLSDQVPALAIVDIAGEPPGSGSAGPAEPWIVLVLNGEAIRARILPELVRRRFGENGEYDVAIVRRADPSDVLYRSRADFSPASIERPDAEASLFAVRSGPEPPPEGARTRDDARAALHARVREGAPGPGRGAWILLASHRAGSLQAAVASIRRRNLAVGGGILALLAATAGALLTSVYRAHVLARQQVEFVAGLTHELRTPLAAIRSAGQNLADGVVSDPERVREYGGLLEREGRRLSRLIEDALAHAGIGGSRAAARTGPVSIPDILEEAIAACASLAAEQGAIVEKEIAPDLPTGTGDREALRTLFENLVSNAIKYGGPDGRVTVGARGAGGEIEVTVRDRGPGIARGELPRIFEPFYRGAGAASSNVPGSGLGLALVRRIAERHGWEIEVESEGGSGTVFRVTLPALPAAADGLAPAPADAS
jgi:signal transduction histidine kinase